MSYESRRKKRQHKRIEARARSKRTEETARRWFLTVAKQPGKFGCCGGRFDRGDDIVFRYEPNTIRCIDCAPKDPESREFRPSIRWERARRADRSRSIEQKAA